MTDNMEIKPGKVSSFIPEYSKLIVSASSDSAFCIEFGIAGRDYEFEMSKEQAVKLARGILNLSGEERPQGEWIRTGSLGNGNAHYECSKCHYGDEHAESQEVPYCWHCGASMKKGGAE